jgi:probable phosphoglycerate mutase
MKRLILVRHGETTWNAEDRLQGQIDVPLNETGLRQAKQIARALADVPCDAIYTSDLIRAADTAAPIAELHGLTAIPDARLRQSNRGAWQGLTEAEIKAQFPNAYELSQREPLFVPPGGETQMHYQARLRDFFGHLQHAHPDQTVIIVSHGHISRMLICLALGLDFSLGRMFTVSNAAWVDVVFEGGRGRMVQMNVQCHLEGKGPL